MVYFVIFDYLIKEIFMAYIKYLLSLLEISLFFIPILSLASLDNLPPETCSGKSEHTIIFSHVVAETTPKGEGAKQFEQLVEERLNCKVEVLVCPRAECFNDNNVMQELLLDNVQMAAPSLSKFENQTALLHKS